MADATKQLVNCMHNHCCSNRQKRDLFEELDIDGNCAQFRNGQTSYYTSNEMPSPFETESGDQDLEEENQNKESNQANDQDHFWTWIW